MSKTGNIFIDAFSLINVFMPLLPVAFIFIQKKYSKVELILLIILCVFNFAGNLFSTIPQQTNSNLNMIANLFAVIELVFILQICSVAMDKGLKEVINVFLIVFCTAIITFYLSKGAGQKRAAIEIFQDIILIVGPGIVLFDMIQDNSLSIFNNPIFWIGGGSLFYFFIALIVNIAGPGVETFKDSIFISDMANLVRYIFYTLAVLFSIPKDAAKNPY
jgi:hypothetical protein